MPSGLSVTFHLTRIPVEAEEYECATSLAEKYLDFRILVEVCEKTNSAERRNKYLSQFADKVGFRRAVAEGRALWLIG